MDRTQVYGYNRSVSGKATQTQAFHNAINGTITSDGIIVKSTIPLYARAREREITTGEIIGALTAPLDITPIKYDAKNRPSKRYVGEKATVSVNPTNGNATSCNKTYSKLVQKLKRKKG